MKVLVISGNRPWHWALESRLREIAECEVSGWIVERGTPSFRGQGSFYRRFVKRWRRYGGVRLVDQMGFELFARVRAKIKDRKIENSASWKHVPALPHLTVNSLGGEALCQWIKGLNPELIVNLGAGLMDESVFSLAKWGAINIHTGILPKYRGINPIVWALCQGEPEQIGVTIHRIDRGIDTGAVLWQRHIPLDSSLCTLESLTQHAYEEALEGIGSVLSHLKQQGCWPSLQIEGTRYPSYGYFGLTHYLKAGRNLKKYIAERGRGA